MKKQTNDLILLEIKKIKSLMSYSSDKNSGGLINEQDLADEGFGSDIFYGYDDSDEIRYPIYTLGYPDLKPQYKSFNAPVTQIMGPKNGTGPRVFYIGQDINWQKLMPSRKVEYADIKDAAGVEHKNQPYILAKDNSTKLCLPDEKWLEAYKQLNLVYMFQNPKTGDYYSLKLQTWRTPRPFGPKQISVSGIQASKFCYGGDNGWEFSVNNVISKEGRELPPFAKLGTDIYWDISNEKMFDPRSDDDIFWDTYGLTIEIVVGIAVAFFAPELGAIILYLAEGGLIYGIFGEFIIGLAGIGYGTSNMLVITTEILTEAGLLLPYAQNQISRGDTTSAGIMLLFCMLPFVTELKGVHAWLSKGLGMFIKSDVDLLLRTVESSGGWAKILSLSPAEINAYRLTLKAGERDVFDAGFNMMRNINNLPNGNTEFVKFVGDFFNQNAGVILKKAQQKGFTETEKAVAGVTNLLVGLSSPLAVLTGKGLISQLGRGFLTIGPVAIGLQKLADKLQELFPGEPDEWKVKQMELLDNVFKENKNPQEILQFKIMAELYHKMGWEVGKSNLETILADTTEVMKTEEYKNASDGIKKDLVSKKIKELSEKKNTETLKETVEVFVDNKEQLILLVDLANIIEKETEIFEIITTKLGFINFEWKDGTHPKDYSSDWNFIVNESTNTNKKINGKIVFDKSLGTFEIYLIDRTDKEEKIYPEKSTPTNKVTFDKKD